MLRSATTSKVYINSSVIFKTITQANNLTWALVRTQMDNQAV